MFFSPIGVPSVLAGTHKLQWFNKATPGHTLVSGHPPACKF